VGIAERVVFGAAFPFAVVAGEATAGAAFAAVAFAAAFLLAVARPVSAVGTATGPPAG